MKILPVYLRNAFAFFGCFLLFTGCQSTLHRAPVVDISDYQQKINQLTKSSPRVSSHKPARSGLWLFPSHGKIRQGFSTANKGIDITGYIGQPIYAVRKGQVVYSGNGIKGYGNLIIIKHDDAYLSTYAYNSRLLVREGETVKSGERIAEMGSVGNIPTLHFELRRNGKPINPIFLFNK